MQDKFGSKDWLKARLLPFLALALSACIPILHAAILFPYGQLQKQAGLNYYYIEGAFMVTGVAFLAVSFLLLHRAQVVLIEYFADKISRVLAARTLRFSRIFAPDLPLLCRLRNN